MNILGHEIDPTFVYQIGKIFSGEGKPADESFYYFFEIRFKDGRSHTVSLSYNYSTIEYKGREYVQSEFLSKKQKQIFPKKRAAAQVKIKELRNLIIKAMNK